MRPRMADFVDSRDSAMTTPVVLRRSPLVRSVRRGCRLLKDTRTVRWLVRSPGLAAPPMPEQTRHMPSAFDAYLGPDEAPLFIYSCVLYWDVLGVKNHSRAPDALSRLVTFDAALKRARARALFEDPDFPDHAVTWLTDNVVIGTPVSDDSHVIEMALGSNAIGAAYMQL